MTHQTHRNRRWCGAIRWIWQKVNYIYLLFTSTWHNGKLCQEVLPKSEHCTTLKWHWHLKGHNCWGGTKGGISSSGPGRGLGLGTVGASASGPSPEGSSIMKSKKPDWRKGRPAQHTDTESRKRQADLMVQLTSLWGGVKRIKGQRAKVKEVRKLLWHIVQPVALWDKLNGRP